MLNKSTSLYQVSSSSKDGIIATTYKDDLIVRGQGRSIRKVFTLSSGAKQNIIIVTADNDYPIFCLPIIVNCTVGRVDFKIADSSNFTYTALGATILYVVDRFGLKACTTPTKFYFAPTEVAITGNYLDYFIGTESTNQSSGGGAVIGQSPFLLLPNEKYLFQFANESGGTTRVSLQQDFYEQVQI